MTTREIVATFKEMYDADVSASLISKVTNAVIEQVLMPSCQPLSKSVDLPAATPESTD